MKASATPHVSGSFTLSRTALRPTKTVLLKEEQPQVKSSIQGVNAPQKVFRQHLL
jgi:hypothetical protein